MREWNKDLARLQGFLQLSPLIADRVTIKQWSVYGFRTAQSMYFVLDRL
jgi:hypothetical protein